MRGRDYIEKRLLRALGRSSLSRYAIAKRIGVSQAQLSRFVHGQRRLGLGTAASLADALGLELVLRPKAPRGHRGGKGA
jgi:transcriptional regulator with XRE-family HTH domain